MSAPRVLNIRHLPLLVQPAGVYVGRPSKWGNQFVIGRDGTRAEVVQKHAASITPEQAAAAKRELRGQDLICWCAPLPCHAENWLKVANE